jgi:hypothetical protein
MGMMLMVVIFWNYPTIMEVEFGKIFRKHESYMEKVAI